MIEEPGSFSGSDNSPRPDLGPEPKNLISFAILLRDAASVLRAPLRNTSESFDAKASNLLGAVMNS